MRITIDRSLVQAETEKDVISRIPGRRPDGVESYLYLKKEDIVSSDKNTIVANIENGHNYIVGGKNPDGAATLIRGETLQKSYIYAKQFDPEQRQQAAEQRQQTAVQRQVTQQVNGQKQQQVQQVSRQQQAVQQDAGQRQQQVQQVSGQRQQAQPVQQQQAPQQTAQQSQRLNQSYSRDQFRQLKLGQKNHVDVTKFWNIHLQPEQMRELRLMLESNVAVDQLGYNDPKISAEQLSELRRCHKHGLIPPENWKRLKVDQLAEIRRGMEAGVDTRQYGWPGYTAGQMKELRLGLTAGFDISGYRNPHFAESQMRGMRHQQIFEQVKEQLKALLEKFKEFFHLNNLNRIRESVVEKVSDYLDTEVSMHERMFATQEETLDDRIKETVADIKELLAAQELVPEEVMTNQAVSEQMEARIRTALDDLMKPETIADKAAQEAVIEQAATETIKQAGATLNKATTVQELLTNQDLLDQFVEAYQTSQVRNEVDLKDFYEFGISNEVYSTGKISEDTLADMQKNGYQLTGDANNWQVEPIQTEEQSLQDAARELLEEAQMQAQTASLVRA